MVVSSVKKMLSEHNSFEEEEESLSYIFLSAGVRKIKKNRRQTKSTAKKGAVFNMLIWPSAD
jgi:hypothetical protein